MIMEWLKKIPPSPKKMKNKPNKKKIKHAGPTTGRKQEKHTIQQYEGLFLRSLDEPDRSMITYTFPSGSKSICRATGRESRGSEKANHATVGQISNAEL